MMARPPNRGRIGSWRADSLRQLVAPARNYAMCEKTGVVMIPPGDSAGVIMKRFVEGADRGQSTLLPECLDDWIDESNAVCAVDAFIDALDLAKLGFEGVAPEVT